MGGYIDIYVDSYINHYVGGYKNDYIDGYVGGYTDGCIGGYMGGCIGGYVDGYVLVVWWRCGWACRWIRGGASRGALEQFAESTTGLGGSSALLILNQTITSIEPAAGLTIFRAKLCESVQKLSTIWIAASPGPRSPPRCPSRLHR